MEVELSEIVIPHEDYCVVHFTDPINAASVSFYWHDVATIERIARLCIVSGIAHRMSVGEVCDMARAILHGIDPDDDTTETIDEELVRRIRQAKSDARALRWMREKGGGSFDELIAILERSHEGLRWQMEIDPARADEIAAKIEASQRRIRRMVMDHNRAVRASRREKARKVS